MMNILFIGGTGFFGKAFINYIKTNNISDINQITIVGRSADSFLADNPEFKQLENVKYISADILNDMTQLEGHNFSHVVHSGRLNKYFKLKTYRQIRSDCQWN